MANCSCTGSTGSTYATVNRGYGCLSSVPTASSVPYNCFLPPTNMSYYQNFPFYNGPCGTVAGSSSNPGSSGGSSSNCCCCCCPTTGGSSSPSTQPSAPAAPNCCCCCCPTSGSSSGATTQPSAPTAPNCCCCCPPSGSSSGTSTQPSAPTAPNCCICCCPPQSSSSSDPSSVPSTPLMPAIPTGKCCFPWYYPWCCPTTSEDEEEEEEEDMSSTNPCCCFPWLCNPCCGAPQSVPSTPLMPPACKPCKPNPCCQPAALIATSNGSFTPAANGLVPLTLVNTLSSALSLMGDTITINCPGTYLVTLSSNIPGTSNYAGNVSVALNGSPIATTTQAFTASTASQNTTQAIVKATKGSTLTITTSALGSAAINPAAGTNLFTISVVRIA